MCIVYKVLHQCPLCAHPHQDHHPQPGVDALRALFLRIRVTGGREAANTPVSPQSQQAKCKYHPTGESDQLASQL